MFTIVSRFTHRFFYLSLILSLLLAAAGGSAQTAPPVTGYGVQGIGSGAYAGGPAVDAAGNVYYTSGGGGGDAYMVPVACINGEINTGCIQQLGTPMGPGQVSLYFPSSKNIALDPRTGKTYVTGPMGTISGGAKIDHVAPCKRRDVAE